MAFTLSPRIWQALTRFIRGLDLDPALAGGIHRGVAPEPTPYPFLIINPLPATHARDWSGLMLVGAVDIIVVSTNSVDAERLDQSIAAALDEAELAVAGQEHMTTIRLNDLNLEPDEDADKHRLFMAGGTYEIWTQQNA